MAPRTTSDVTPTPVPANESDDRRPYKVVTMSEKFRDAVEAFAKENNLSVATLFRTAVATHIGYDLSAEPVTARRVKHASERDKLIAHRVASFKAGLQRKLALQGHKARLAGKADELAKLDAELAAVLGENWEPAPDVLEKITKGVDEALAKASPAPQTESDDSDES